MYKKENTYIKKTLPEINELDPRGNSQCVSLMPVFIILCFKGQRGTPFISRRLFEALIVSTFLTTLSDNSALEARIQRSAHRLFTAIKITRTSLRKITKAGRG